MDLPLDRYIDKEIEPKAQSDVDCEVSKLPENSYIIPKWCKLDLYSHADGMGGCWGISSGLQPKEGEGYCKDCEYYKAC